MRTLMRNATKKNGDDKPDDKELRTIFARNLAEGEIKLCEVQAAADIHHGIQGKERKIYDRLRYWIKKDIVNSPSVSAKELKENPSDALFDDDMESEKSSSGSENDDKPTERHTFTKEETYVIKTVFKEEIEKNALISREKVKKIMARSTALKAMFNENDIRPLAVKVWNLRRAYRKGQKK